MTIKSGRAEHQLGKDDSPREKDSAYYSRGYIPHFNQPGALQSITYRLEDSLPAHVVERLYTEFAARSDDNLDVKKRIRIQELLDAGHGSCILQHPDAAQLVVDTWKRFDGERYDLIEWVVMPNHVHVLIRVYPEQLLSKIVRSWKSYTGRKIKPLLMQHYGDKKDVSRVWMRGYWDRFIRNEEHLMNTITYIHWNPVKAGFVKRPEVWEWSSARLNSGPR